jgi:hypothetical protein
LGHPEHSPVRVSRSSAKHTLPSMDAFFQVDDGEADMAVR